MAKLYFKYGTMGSSKTANLLMTKYNYEQKNKKTLLLKPKIDDRYGEDIVQSRTGIKAVALIIDDDYDINSISDVDVVLVDEAQFLSEEQIDGLHMLAIEKDIPVICYGLLTDFQTHLFTGSKRLIEVAESVSEIKTICKCGKKATVNARMSNGQVVNSGNSIMIGGDETYESMCYECWVKELEKQKEQKCNSDDIVIRKINELILKVEDEHKQSHMIKMKDFEDVSSVKITTENILCGIPFCNRYEINLSFECNGYSMVIDEK